jgi:hypothetical protein
MWSLRELLAEIDFGYTVNRGVVSLVDYQEGNLGNIEAETFTGNPEENKLQILDRLEKYWDDYGMSKEVSDPDKIEYDLF